MVRRFSPETSRRLRESKKDARTMEYRRLQARASEAARAYDGTEASYRQLMSLLEAWEDNIKDHSDSNTAEDAEIATALELNEVNPKVINELLMLAQRSADKKTREAIAAAFHDLIEGVTQDGIAIRRISGEILPPGEVGRSNGSGRSEEKFSIEGEDTQLFEFIALLEANGIFRDDIVISIGSKYKEDRRYVAVEIPRIGRTVLISNNLGEGAYVIQGSIPDDLLVEQTKQDYKQRAFARLGRLIPRGANWTERMRQALFSDDGWSDYTEDKRSKKMDVRSILEEREKYREIVTAQMSDLEYLEMGFGARATALFGDTRISGLARIFGVEGKPHSSLGTQLKIGLAIWPESEAMQRSLHLAERTPEQWQEEFRKKMTPEQWIAMSSAERIDFSVDGRKISSFATFFGYSGNVAAQVGQLELGLHVWPESEVLKHALEVEQRTPEQWKRAIRKQMTPEQWVAMTMKERVAFAVDGRGLWAIAKAMNSDASVTADTFGQIQFGLEVWPESEVLKHALEVEQRTPEQWKQALRSYVTDVEYLAMNVPIRRNIVVDGKTIQYIAGVIGIKDFVKKSMVGHIEFGLIIWPESEVLKHALEVESRTSEEWKQVIREQITPTEWVAMTIRERAERKFDGKGIGAIGSILQMKNTAKIQRYAEPQLEFGLIIWPESVEMQHALEVERRTPPEWITRIRSELSDSSWASMTAFEQVRYAVDGLRVTALATKLGVEGNMVSSKKARIQFGLTIWPESKILRDILEQLQ